eukprot:CAMPEP_0172318800 /NCGR_PEP_ID=MMETSP1058-20130122/35826_1 /TAXON_ID=83371 /ORGANISM="Detonula confervacea, Strain CCMP 353" /LENGTH=36 /DNA_ID= /DNA_START= /DNA_END= /DNA_ORIENTATION=
MGVVLNNAGLANPYMFEEDEEEDDSKGMGEEGNKLL